jgi:NAD(P)-dependent dehydrogenase (short-subunit alcohol dehydrogenase family)
MKTVVLTGANRGIGLEIAKVLARRGDALHATARNLDDATALKGLAAEHANVTLHTLDVSSDGSVSAFAKGLGDVAVDVLVNNAGVSSSWAGLSGVSSEEMLRVFDVNAAGPMRVTKALVTNLKRAQGVIFHVSSQVGSIGDNTSGGAYAYRASKAALNMASVCLAHELRGDRVASIVIHPGWVQTDMGGVNAPMMPVDCARHLVKLIDDKGLAESGKFLKYDGSELPW